MFTRAALTPPEVNGFGWNLGNSEYIVWSCPWQILGAIRAEAATEARAEILIFFWPLNNARFHRLPVGRVSQNLHKNTCFRVRMWDFGNHLWKFAHKGSCSQKNLHFGLIEVNDLRLPAAILRNDYKSWKVMTGWTACWTAWLCIPMGMIKMVWL